MSFLDTTVNRLLVGKMNWLSGRQEVIARNVANANTPGYVARDVTDFDFASLVNAASKNDASMPKVTNEKHISPSQGYGRSVKVIPAKYSEVLPSGNSVDLEEQMMTASRVATDYQGFIAALRKVSGFIRTAIGK